MLWTTPEFIFFLLTGSQGEACYNFSMAQHSRRFFLIFFIFLVCRVFLKREKKVKPALSIRLYGKLGVKMSGVSAASCYYLRSGIRPMESIGTRTKFLIQRNCSPRCALFCIFCDDARIVSIQDTKNAFIRKKLHSIKNTNFFQDNFLLSQLSCFKNNIFPCADNLLSTLLHR